MSETKINIDRWNELLDSITEEEAIWLYNYPEHKDALARQLQELEDFVMSQAYGPSAGSNIHLERLLILIKQKVNKKND